MGAVKRNIMGSDYVGAFATATDKYVFLGRNLSAKNRALFTEALAAEPIAFTIFGSDLVGLFTRANSNGIVITNMIEDYELAELKRNEPDMNITVMESNNNALGNNIIVNDKMAIVNPDYGPKSVAAMRDTFGVEIIRQRIGGFKTVGANNILTNKGFVISNRATDEEKESVDKMVGFKSERSTANTGSLNVGLSVVANSKGLIFGDNTTGYEMARIMNALGLND